MCVHGATTTYAKLEVKTASTTSRERSLALIMRRTMMNGIGKIRRSVRRLAQVTHMSISPMRWRSRQCRPPKVLGFHVFPVCGGQMKMYMHHGTRALPMVKTRMPYRTFFIHSMTDPARRSSSMMEAFTSGMMGMLMRLNARRT